jgi:cysteine desulfurase
MAANNETGVIQPLAEISKICRVKGVLLHSDMVQSFGKVDIDPAGAGLVDAASFAAHKFYGPKGAGLLFLRSGLSIQPIMFGGAHENERRPGTENVAAIAGMAAAAEFVQADRDAERDRQLHLREDLWQRIARAFPAAQQNAIDAPRLANTLNVSFTGIDSETMLMALDLEGVCASSGSACMVGSVVASHVLLAMGLPMERARELGNSLFLRQTHDCAGNRKGRTGDRKNRGTAFVAQKGKEREVCCCLSSFSSRLNTVAAPLCRGVLF